MIGEFILVGTIFTVFSTIYIELKAGGPKITVLPYDNWIIYRKPHESGTPSPPCLKNL